MADNFFNIPGFNGLSYNPQMPYAQMPGLANIGQQRNPIQAGNPMQNQPGNPMQTNPGSNYTMQPSWQFGLNYNQIAFSNAVQGIGGFLKQNNQRKDFNTYNRVQKNPLSQLPENPNNSDQSLYGMRQYKMGGLKKYDGGGDGPGDNKGASTYSPQDNYYRSSAKLAYYKGILNDQLKAKDPDGYQSYFKGLVDLRRSGKTDDANAYVQNSSYNTYLAPEDVKKTLGDQYNDYLDSIKNVNSYNVKQGQQPLYGTKEGDADLTTLNYGRRFASLQVTPSLAVHQKSDSGKDSDYGRQYTYNPTTHQVEYKETGDTSLKPSYLDPVPPATPPPNQSAQSTATSFAEGGRFDNFDDFDEDDFDDLKDELDNYFKTKDVPKEDSKEEQPKVEDKQPEEQEQPEEQRHSGAMDFLLSPQQEDPDDKDDDEAEGQVSDQALSDGLVGKAPLPKPQLNPSIYAQKSTDDLTAFKKGIAQVENAGYQEGNKNSTAFGKYQFTAPTRENVREQYFSGISKADFEKSYKADPQFQERVMDVYGNHLLQTYGGDAHKAALAFYLGPGKANYTNQPDYNPGGGNVTVGKYLSTFDKGYASKKEGGHIMNAPGSVDIGYDRQNRVKENYFKEGGEYELSDAQIKLLKSQGYQIDIIK